MKSMNHRPDDDEEGEMPPEGVSRTNFARQSTSETSNMTKKFAERQEQQDCTASTGKEPLHEMAKRIAWLDLKPSNSSTSLRKRKDLKVVGLKDAIRSRSLEKTQTMSIEQEEKEVRARNHHNSLSLLITGNIAAIKIFTYYLVTIETLLVLAATIGLTLYWYYTYRFDPTWGASRMDWFIVGFAVVGPMSASLTMTFTRREAALLRLSQVRSYAYHIYLAHALWDWDHGNGRANCTEKDWLEHSDAVMAQLVGIADELSRFLTLPSSTRSRHRMTTSGRNDAVAIMNVSYKLLDSLSTLRMTRLTKYSENIKTAGLGASEVSRIRQYERWLGESIEALRQYKLYRTPQALRSFARVFTICLPPFYAPTFASLAIEVQSLGVGLFMGIFVTLALMALFQSIQVLEDPFVAYLTLDGIDVREELEVLFWQQLVDTRNMVYPEAPPYPEAPRKALTPGGTMWGSKVHLVDQEHEDEKDLELGTLQLTSVSGHHRLKSFEILNLSDVVGGESFSTDRPHRIRLHTAEGPEAL